MKTAIQQIIDDLKNIMDDERYEIGKAAVNDCIIAATSYLETEKHQIIDARIDGVAKSLTIKIDAVDPKLSEQYYKETFETNKETLK